LKVSDGHWRLSHFDSTVSGDIRTLFQGCGIPPWV
jgi:hypothetical protein